MVPKGETTPVDRDVGLFRGMFDKNILTCNPGWTSDAPPHFDLELAFPVEEN